MSQTVLVIEDDTRIADWVKVYLERAGFAAEVAHDGKTGLDLARALCPDLIVLDLMLPGLDGMSLCRILRRESDVPIIMLTAKGARSDRIEGLDSGADDYVSKPFDPDELVARVKAVLRRTTGSAQRVLTCSTITLEETTRSVTRDGQPIHLSQAQFALLTALMRHPNQVLTRDQLIALAFGDDYDAYDRAIDTHIRRLRKLIHTKQSQPIRTVYGVGYRLVCEAD